MKEPILPVEPEPSDIFHDCFRIFGFFRNRIGVVQTEIANTLVFSGDSEIQANTFRMSQM